MISAKGTIAFLLFCIFAVFSFSLYIFGIEVIAHVKDHNANFQREFKITSYIEDQVQTSVQELEVAPSAVSLVMPSTSLREEKREIATIQQSILTTSPPDNPTTQSNHPEVSSEEELSLSLETVTKKSVIVLTNDNLIDTTKTRINFSEDTWYDEFLEIQEALGKYQGFTEESINMKVSQSEGYSVANLTEVYAVITNACIRKPFNVITLFEKEKNKIKSDAMQQMKLKDFYYNNVVSELKPIEISQVDFSEEHTLVVHPRQYSNIFHIVEGTSVILYLAIHPEQFPNIKNIIIAQQPGFAPDSWAKVVEELYLQVFPDARRPVYGFDTSVKVKCDRSMVVAKSWEPQGTGSFMSEYLAADMFRAAAYKLIHWTVRKPVDNKLNTLVVNRVTKRKILNSDELYETIVNELGSKLNVTYQILEKLDAYSQIHLFANTDIVVAAHGAGLTNIIFMTPQSYVYELFPPYWQFSCYRRLAANMELQYMKTMAVGEKGPECLKDENSISCLYAGIRDRDFTIDIEGVLKNVKKAIQAVRKMKFPSMTFG